MDNLEHQCDIRKRIYGCLAVRRTNIFSAFFWATLQLFFAGFKVIRAIFQRNERLSWIILNINVTLKENLWMSGRQKDQYIPSFLLKLFSEEISDFHGQS